MSKPFERLPKHAVPLHYEVKLTPQLESWTFFGQVSIHLNVKESKNFLKLNTADLKVQKAILSSNGKQIPAKSICTDEKEETTRIEFDSDVPTVDAVLQIEFDGHLNNQMKGFYRSTYTHEGKEHRIATTQFESTDARRAFPCFDEPALKATFSVTLYAPEGFTALSNMPCIKSQKVTEGKNAGLIEHQFDKTPIMSTYLLAFIVGEFEYVEAKTASGLPVRSYAPLGKGHLGKFSLDVATRVLPFFEEFFDLKFPLPKLDQIAIPDFAMGAMENWGLVTYRETALLLDEQNSSLAMKQRVALVVCHEIAHSWFGNYVTMSWWDSLWLNEGFAKWVEHLGVDHLFPEWKIWDYYCSTIVERAMQLDSLRSSHPIEVPVNHPDEITEIFDMISYAKGSTVVRMIYHLLGEQDFRKGLAAYLKKFSFKNTETSDLWRALEEASGKPVAQIMSTWTKKVGYPVLKVSEPKIEGKEIIYEVTQYRFLQSGLDESDATVWTMPVSFLTPEGVVSNQMFSEKSGKLVLPFQNEVPKFVKFNAGQVGLYRVLYPPSMRQALAQAVRDKALPIVDRLALLSDVAALTRAGLLNAKDLLDFLSAFEAETEYAVWSEINSVFSALAAVLLHDEELSAKLSKFIVQFTSRMLDVVGWEKKEGESTSQSLLRPLIISLLSRHGHEGVVAESLRRFGVFYEKTKAGDTAGAAAALPADLRAPVYACVVKFGTPAHYDQILVLHDLITLHEEKLRLLQSLGSTRDPQLLQRTIELALTEEKVRNQDAWIVLNFTAVSKLGVEKVWGHVSANWDTMVKKFGGQPAMGSIAELSGGWTSHEKANEIEEFFKTHACPAGERSCVQSVERIRTKARWLERDHAHLCQILNKC